MNKLPIYLFIVIMFLYVAKGYSQKKDGVAGGPAPAVSSNPKATPPALTLNAANYKNFADKETSAMVNKLNLDKAQEAKLDKINAVFYQQLASAFQQRDAYQRKMILVQLKANRDKELAQLLSATQRNKYIADMAAVHNRTQARVNKLNEEQKAKLKVKEQVKEVKPEKPKKQH